MANDQVDVIEQERLKLSTKLHTLAKNVYFQPPSNKKLEYPCIIYKLMNGNIDFADDVSYIFKPHWQLTVIDYIPNSPIRYQLIMTLPSVTFVDHFVSDELNHDVFQLY